MKIILNELQQAVYDLIVEEKSFGVFLDMGVGKTALMLSLIEYLVYDKMEMHGNILIIAPKGVSNKTQVWQEEIKKWDNFSFFNYVELHGTPKKREQLFEKNNRGNIFIMSDSLLGWWRKTYEDLLMFDMVIVDESSRFKTHNSERFMDLASMTDPTKQRIYLLSGTPIPNGYQDLWSQMFLIDRGERLHKSYWGYIAHYFNKFEYHLYLTKAGKDKILEKVKDKCVFADNTLTLPPIHHKPIFLDFDEEMMDKYRYFEEQYILELAGNRDVSVLEARTLVNKCLQVANGSVYYDKKQNYERVNTTKLDYIKSLIYDTHKDENMIVFYLNRFNKEELLREIPEARLINNIKDVRDWNEGKIRVGVVSPFSLQYGANLQRGGRIVVWYGLWWGLENFLQANRRVWRQGQTKEVIVYYVLVRGTRDEDVFVVLNSKEKEQSHFLNKIRTEIQKRNMNSNNIT